MRKKLKNPLCNVTQSGLSYNALFKVQESLQPQFLSGCTMDWKLIFILLSPQICWGLLDLPPPCDSKIYCISSNQSLLHVVQMARLYKDSKTFVDKAIKTNQETVLKNFENLMKVSDFYKQYRESM